jgi:hypothetical protein
MVDAWPEIRAEIEGKSADLVQLQSRGAFNRVLFSGPRDRPTSPTSCKTGGNPMNSADFSPPAYARIPDACRHYGLSRSRLYLLAGDGLIRFVKVGNATLVDLGSVRDYLADRPAAQVRAPKAA